MKLTDWIGLISFAGIAAYSITAGVKLIKNSRKQAVRIGEGAVLRYSDFTEAADLPVCCKAVRALAARGGTSIEYSFTKKDDVVLRVEIHVGFCPGCGRKLK